MSKFLYAMIGFIFGIGLGSLIFWGLGNLVIWVFHLDYTWTFMHGIVADLIWLLISGLFKQRSDKNV